MLNPIIPVLYIGLHVDTPSFIDGDPFFIRSMARLDFVHCFTLNPANLLFQITYLLLQYHFIRLAKVAYALWTLVKPCAGILFFRYDKWLEVAVKNGALLIDVEDLVGLHNTVNRLGIQIIVVNCWGLLPLKVCESLKYGCVNVHPSRLPAYRGSVPTLSALQNEDTETAVSIMQLDSGIDSGKVITQLTLPIEKNDTALTLESKIDLLLKTNLHHVLRSYVDGESIPVAQFGVPTKTPKYLEYRAVRGDEKLRDVFNKVQLYPYIEPGVFCHVTIAGKCIELRRVFLEAGSATLPPGTYKVVRCRMYIGVSDGVCYARLFKDVSLVASMLLLWKTAGSITP